MACHAPEDPGADLEVQVSVGSRCTALTNLLTMKTTALLVSLLASASAFAPASQSSTSSTALNNWKASSPYKDELGVQAPVRTNE